MVKLRDRRSQPCTHVSWMGEDVAVPAGRSVTAHPAASSAGCMLTHHVMCMHSDGSITQLQLLQMLQALQDQHGLSCGYIANAMCCIQSKACSVHFLLSSVFLQHMYETAMSSMGYQKNALRPCTLRLHVHAPESTRRKHASAAWAGARRQCPKSLQIQDLM